MRRHEHVVNPGELEWTEEAHGEKFAYRRKQLGAPAGGKMLGCSLFRLEPGKTAFPAHLHHGNEEAVYILEGEGEMRLGDEEIPVGKGDYVALPTEGPAHQLLNTSAAPLEYLCISTMFQPDVMEYPDSGKVGAIAGAAPGGDKAQRRMCKFFKGEQDVGYYEGE